MAANVTLPNPYTPLAFVPPEIQTKIQIQTYAYVGSLAVLLWDIILHLSDDYKLATHFRINISFIVYAVARLASLTYILGLVIFTTAPIGNCDLVRKVSVLYPFTIPLSTLLFVMRVFALYRNNKFVIVFFSFTWLALLGGCIAVPIGAIGMKIGTTRYCYDAKTKLVDALGSFIPLIHDTLIFIATAWGLMKHSYTDPGLKNNIEGIVLGNHLPAFSRSILRDGQAYYLASLIMNLFTIVLYYLPNAPITSCTIGLPAFVVLSNMASHVYRNLRFGCYRDTSMTSSAINKAFQRSRQSRQRPHDIVFTPPSHLTNPDKSEDTGDLESGFASRSDQVLS